MSLYRQLFLRLEQLYSLSFLKITYSILNEERHSLLLINFLKKSRKTKQQSTTKI